MSELHTDKLALLERTEEARLSIRDILESYQEDNPPDLEEPQEVFSEVLYVLEQCKIWIERHD